MNLKANANCRGAAGVFSCAAFAAAAAHFCRCYWKTHTPSDKKCIGDMAVAQAFDETFVERRSTRCTFTEEAKDG
ncbi:MAG TPA: hypothetical protein VLI90_11845 [Tepidisphaeraceae bacterium]|nr:hypothetical protein [Tepidisphaeraceae bacterium]